MGWFANNIIETMLIIGIILLIIEVVVLGFSTFFLFFTGLAAIATAIVMWFGLLPETFLYGVFSVAAFTALFAVLLWKTLSNLQKDVDNTRAQSDLIGHSFVLPSDVNAIAAPAQQPDYLFSGVSWKLDAHQDIAKGTLVEVVQVDVGVLLIQQKDIKQKDTHEKNA